jgi:diaminopimelate decarboxylase
VRGVAPADPIARHLLPITAAVGPSGALSVGGRDLLELAEEFGTPLFVYDEAHLRIRCREAVAAFGPGVAYGTKAFLCKAMAALAGEEGMCLDVSTGGELAVALAAGVPASRLVLHGNNKSSAELEAAIRSGVGTVVVDSSDEIDRIAALGALPELLAGGPLRVLVRVTPGVEAHTHEYVMTGQEDTKFGFSLSTGAADEAVERLRSLPFLALAGVHAHVGSQIFRVDVFAQEVAALTPFVRRHSLDECCVGGGLGVAYLNDETSPSMAEWAAVVHSAFSKAGLPGVRVTAEPGRSIVATAAVTLYRVGTVKVLPGLRTYVAVDGGMSDNPRPVLYGSGYEAFLPRAPLAARPRVVRVVGKHCESGDVLVEAAHVPADIDVGDVLATPVTGAYGYSMASNYNRLPRPAVVFVSGGEARLVLRRETNDDMLALES